MLPHSRRSFFRRNCISLSAFALANLLAGELADGETSVPHTQQPQSPHFPPSAKHVIYIHMIGAPSQLDLFDPKPMLNRFHNQACPVELTKGRDFAFIGKSSALSASPYEFSQHGESGHTFSELLPHLASVSDELTFVRSVHTDEINHAPAQLFLHSGLGRSGRPSVGSWVTYGLGSESEELPAYVVLVSGPKGGAGTALWSSGFLPTHYQGVQLRSEGDAILFLSNPAGESKEDRRNVLDALKTLNELQYNQTGDSEIITRIRQYEMAYRMQMSAPDLVELKGETIHTLQSYGAQLGVASFANNCLLARRLVERGVRMVELYDSDWDHHNNLTTRLPQKCRQTDQAVAALLKDLKERGLLDETLVVWGSEFGRTPLRQGEDNANAGRDHHKDAFTIWMAGGGIKRGICYGQTDDFGMDVVENPVHIHDLNATILHLLGIRHERLTYRYQGRDFRLTDVHGKVIREVLNSSREREG